MIDAGSGIASVDAIVESVLEAGNAAHWAVDGANGYQEFRSVADSDGEEEVQIYAGEARCSMFAARRWS